jgi:hypothetical protein
MPTMACGLLSRREPLSASANATVASGAEWPEPVRQEPQRRKCNQRTCRPAMRDAHRQHAYRSRADRSGGQADALESLPPPPLGWLGQVTAHVRHETSVAVTAAREDEQLWPGTDRRRGGGFSLCPHRCHVHVHLPASEQRRSWSASVGLLPPAHARPTYGDMIINKAERGRSRQRLWRHKAVVCSSSPLCPETNADRNP